MMSKTLLALACLAPLTACAAQPTAAGGAEPSVAAPAPAPSTRQTAPAPASAGSTATAATGPADSAPPSSPAAARPASIPAAERATTVGEVPATTGTPGPAPDLASMPAAPAAIPAAAAGAPPANPAPLQVGQATAAPSAGTLLQTILALALVLALLAALAWAMKRYGPKMSGNSANLRMVGALNIGGRERIMVVEVGDQWIVVGASPGRVNALATMPRGEGTAAAAGTATLAGHAPPAATFSDWLKQTIDKRNAK